MIQKPYFSLKLQKSDYKLSIIIFFIAVLSFFNIIPPKIDNIGEKGFSFYLIK